jgi:hypothetical protein
MSTLVESLKRLYLAGKVTIDKLNTMLSQNKITQEEYDYIIAGV